MVNTPRRKLTGGRLEAPSWGERKVPQEWPLGKGVDAIGEAREGKPRNAPKNQLQAPHWRRNVLTTLRSRYRPRRAFPDQADELLFQPQPGPGCGRQWDLIRLEGPKSKFPAALRGGALAFAW